jgi:hypothetical protein
MVESAFDDDADIKAALSVFNDMERYQRLLKGK